MRKRLNLDYADFFDFADGSLCSIMPIMNNQRNPGSEKEWVFIK
jgi:hypothetical protein